MKMKKLTTIALAAAMAIGTFGFSVPAKAAENSTDYTITIPATLSVESAGWNATDGITAKVKSGDTFDASKKLSVTAVSANSWALKSGENSVGYNLATASGTYSSSAAPATWEFSADELNAESGTNKPMGINVQDYTQMSIPAGEYKDTVTFTAKVEDAVKVETLLTTLTFGGSSTYSETTSGVVSVTATNVTSYDAQYGWLWYSEGSLSVTAKEGYTITKCVFIQNAKTPITDTEAPFEIHSSDRGYITEQTRMDGVTSIEVYGYAN